MFSSNKKISIIDSVILISSIGAIVISLYLLYMYKNSSIHDFITNDAITIMRLLSIFLLFIMALLNGVKHLNENKVLSYFYYAISILIVICFINGFLLYY